MRIAAIDVPSLVGATLVRSTTYGDTKKSVVGIIVRGVDNGELIEVDTTLGETCLCVTKETTEMPRTAWTEEDDAFFSRWWRAHGK